MARVRDKSTAKNHLDRVFVRRNGVVITAESYTTSVVSHDRMEDVVTPRFKHRSGKGEIFISPMSKLRSQSEVVAGANLTLTSITSPGVVTTWVRESNAVASYDPRSDTRVIAKVASAESLAITDAYGEVGKADVATLTELAELRETLGFLMSPARKMLDITRRLRSHHSRITRMSEAYEKRLAKWTSLPEHVKKRREKPKRVPFPSFKWGKVTVDDVASLWLAYRYAIMPLIYTFEDISKHLARTAYPIRETARNKKNESIDVETLAESSRSHDGKTYKDRVHTTLSANIVSRAGVLYTPDWSIQRQLGFQMHRVPMAMYEIIPLSFVTDWFHNGASYYDALTAELRALKIHGAWVTTMVTYQHSWHREAVAVSPNLTGYPKTRVFTTTGTWKMRRPVSLADVRLRLRVEMNAKRIVDALALIKVILLSTGKKK